MTRIKSLFAAAVASAIVAVVPAATAQTVHVAGAGSSAQFLSAAIGADSLALGLMGVGTPSSCAGAGDALAVFHYSAKNEAYVIDVRSSNINPEKGNLWTVWTAACSDSTGATGVQDIWLDVSVDSTVGVRAVLAQEATGSGAQIGVITPVASAGNLIGAAAIWPDNTSDVALPASVYNVIGTNITNATVGNDVHVNLGLTDIRPEDALFATTRAIAKYTSTLSGLGYTLIANDYLFGTSILSGQPTSNANATPEAFALGGGTDPMTGKVVPTIVSTPIGAAPIVFGYNNNGASSYPTNLVSGVTGTGVAGGPYSLAHLFDGTTICDTTNAAFGGFSGPTVNVNPILREPLSGTMNTTEYSLFRTTGNTTDSQEKGVSTSTTTPPLNPLSSSNGNCSAGGGFRSRAIGTGEVLGASGKGGIIGTANSLGYFFFSFPNAAKFSGSANYNYLTLDGVDPIGLGTANQTFVNCPVAPATNCTAQLWTGNLSYPTLRNGTYGAWSIYRWVSYTSNTDPVGPAMLAAAAQNAIDTTIADYVPFYTATGGIGGISDGLSVYHSHFTQKGPASTCGGTGCTGGDSVAGYNGTATLVNATNGGNTLGIADRGGDMGGVIEGPFGLDESFSGTVITSGTLTAGKGYKVTWKSGQKFVATANWEGQTITINGTNYTIANVLPTTTILYVNTNPGTQSVAVPYSGSLPTASAVIPGVLNKKR